MKSFELKFHLKLIKLVFSCTLTYKKRKNKCEEILNPLYVLIIVLHFIFNKLIK